MLVHGTTEVLVPLNTVVKRNWFTFSFGSSENLSLICWFSFQSEPTCIQDYPPIPFCWWFLNFWHCFFFCLTRVVSQIGKVNWPIQRPAVWSPSYLTPHKNFGTAEAMSSERERNQNFNDLSLIYNSCESIILQEWLVHRDIQCPPIPLCFFSVVHVISK